MGEVDSWREAHDQRVQQLAREYENEGYTVVVEPKAAALPPWLTQRPDLIARRGTEQVIVEVKVAARPLDRERWSTVAAAAEANGWRFRLVIVGGPAAEQLDYTSAAPEEIEQRLVRAERLAPIDSEAALLLAWGGVEAAARRALLSANATPRATSALSMLKQLVHVGLLGNEELQGLTAIAALRNAVSHGEASVPVTEQSVEALVDAGRRLLSAA